MSPTVEQLSERSQRLQSVLVKLSAKQDALVETKSELLDQLETASQYLEVAEDVTNFLENLQQESQEAEKGFYEDLLTQCVKDVVPSFDGRIVLKTGVVSGRPELEIMCESNGILENVNLDRGGSINNVLSIGLRILCLTKTGNRPFLMFDESDCWLKGEYIPRLAAVIYSLAVRVGIQVLYISHHDPELFKGFARVIQLSKSGNKIYAEEVSSPANCLDAFEGDNAELYEDVGIRYLRMVDYRGHENTRIDLDPRVTVLCGGMDIGKSKCLEAITAVARNEGREKVIRDGSPKCLVEMGIEDGMVIQWSYSRAGSKKTSYKLIDSNGQVVHSSNEGKSVPDWVEQSLALGYVKGIDVNYSNQFNPNFILDRAISKHKRADIFTISSDEKQIQSMLKKHAKECTSKRSEKTTLTTQLRNTKAKLRELQPINVISEHYLQAEKEIISLEAGKDELVKLRDDCKQIKACESEIILAESVIGNMPDLSLLHDQDYAKSLVELQVVIESIRETEDVIGRSNVVLPEGLDEVERLKDDVLGIADIGKQLKEKQGLLEAIDNIPSVNLSQLDIEDFDLLGLYSTINSIEQVIEQGISFKRKIGELEETLDEIHQEELAVKQQIGDKCPLCGGRSKSGSHVHQEAVNA